MIHNFGSLHDRFLERLNFPQQPISLSCYPSSLFLSVFSCLKGYPIPLVGFLIFVSVYLSGILRPNTHLLILLLFFLIGFPYLLLFSSEILPDDNEERKIELGPQRTLKEQFEKDKDDESLRRWKEQLLGTVDFESVGENLEPEVKILSLAIKSPGRPDMVLPIPEDGNPKGLWFTLKEGNKYSLQFTFKVSNNIVSGLKYTNAVWKTGVKVDSTKEMIGTFSPQAEPYTHEISEETTPSGLFARGNYSARSKDPCLMSQAFEIQICGSCDVIDMKCLLTMTTSATWRLTTLLTSVKNGNHRLPTNFHFLCFASSPLFAKSPLDVTIVHSLCSYLPSISCVRLIIYTMKSESKFSVFPESELQLDIQSEGITWALRR
ncbi:hypothetical protein CRYUN_Cryun32bG0015600 [Craigia yunnanensis]